MQAPKFGQHFGYNAVNRAPIAHVQPEAKAPCSGSLGYLLGRSRRAVGLATRERDRGTGLREGLTAEEDRLPERSYGPTRGGALADGGIDREELREAIHTYYGMMGWDRETGVPTVEKLQELGVGWAVEHLPG